MGAKFMEMPELELTEAEGKKLSDSVKEVAKHYNMSMDPKKVAIAQLMMVAGGIYGPRAVAIYRRVNRPKEKLIQVNTEPPKPKEPSVVSVNGPSLVKKNGRLPTPQDFNPTPPVDGFDE